MILRNTPGSVWWEEGGLNGINVSVDEVFRVRRESIELAP